MFEEVYTFDELNKLSARALDEDSGFGEGYCVYWGEFQDEANILLFIGQRDNNTYILPRRSPELGLTDYVEHLLFDVVLDKKLLEDCPFSETGRLKFIYNQIQDSNPDLPLIKDYLNRLGFRGKYYVDEVKIKGCMFGYKAVILDTVLNQEQIKELTTTGRISCKMKKIINFN